MSHINTDWIFILHRSRIYNLSLVRTTTKQDKLMLKQLLSHTVLFESVLGVNSIENAIIIIIIICTYRSNDDDDDDDDDDDNDNKD